MTGYRQRTGAFAMLLMGAVLLAGCSATPADESASSAPTASPTPTATRAPDPVVRPATSGFDRAATDMDVLPENLNTEYVDASTVRYLGATADISFWAGTRSDGSICLMDARIGGSDKGGSTCTKADSYVLSGLVIQRVIGDVSAEGYLVPDDALSSLEGLTTIPGSISENFVLIDPEMSSADRRAFEDLHADDIGFKLALEWQPVSEL